MVEVAAKPLRNFTLYTLHFTFVFAAALSGVAKTFDIDVSTGRPSAANVAYYHGETIEFRAVRGRTAVTNVEYSCIYYQTNGMGEAWWHTDGLVFHPTNDVGASSYRFFLEGRDDVGRDWHANGLLRLLDSPGFEPSAVQLPVQTLDFSRIDVVNAPWPGEIADAAFLSPVYGEETGEYTDWVATFVPDGLTVVAMPSYNGSFWLASFSYNGSEAIQIAAKQTDDPAATNLTFRFLPGVLEPTLFARERIRNVVGYTLGDQTDKPLASLAAHTFLVARVDGVGAVATQVVESVVTKEYVEGLGISSEETDPTVPAWAKASSKPSYTASEVGALPSSTTHLSGDVPTSRKVNNKPLTGDITLQASDVGAYPATDGEALAGQVSAIGATLHAEDAHFVATNYDSNVRLPEAYVEVKMRDEATGSNTWITIWQEMRRWTAFVGSAFDWSAWSGFHAWATNITHELSFKADRCWGIYDSETGGYSPEGYTQISSSNILIAAGMAYQRTVTSGGAVWVLQCNQGTAHVGGDTNGFFRVVDGDGVTQFEIIKGDKREMGADASSITVGSGTPPVVTIPYSVEADEHPTLQVCDNLTTANWKAETDSDCLATVSWSGVSGAYVATVQRKTIGNALFVKASYLAGGETYIHNVAPVGMDSLILGGTRYYLGTATINGHTVLTLSTTAP